MKLEVGQKLWYMRSDARNRPYLPQEPVEVTVTKVGRKWATLSNYERIHVESLVADGGEYVSPGACYPTREAWEVETRTRAAWDMLRKRIDQTGGGPPEGVTIDSIVRARMLLWLG